MKKKAELNAKIQKNLKTSLRTEVAKKFDYKDAKEALEFYTQNMSKGKSIVWK